ncbi:A24 family peptidase [Breoghania sp.]|uniref:A24 family peptidase n=1 Tax=Breoghania sp. TaxID=2065378 RepID=UPI00261AE265|nr:A24 family peptidase [Breoghania sp.]MDJ0929785.1 A24 family peptidase [Breoghania sp.]
MFAVALVVRVVHGPYPGLILVFSLVLAAMLAWGAAVDMREFMIRDTVSLGLIPLGLAATWFIDPIVLTLHVLAAIVGGTLLWAVAEGYRRWRGISELGFGDVKLFAAAGAWLGPQGLPGVLFF